mgnify:CR=1 FL=1
MIHSRSHTHTISFGASWGLGRVYWRRGDRMSLATTESPAATDTSPRAVTFDVIAKTMKLDVAAMHAAALAIHEKVC